ncbi:MAG: AAA family ATPase [Bacteroidales bacterium]|jgi:ATP-dependent 26S proteasome regulatory subunit|nr:AAA family ATPase [Bacteroidales bacterium]
MNLKLKIYSEKDDSRFKKSVGAFASECNYQQLRGSINLKDGDILFAKIECTNPLCKFEVLHQIDCINSSNSESGDDQCVFIHKDIVGNILDSGNLDVEVNAINLATLPIATKVIIKLPEKEVAKWSGDESKQAINTIRTKNQFLVLGKSIFVTPITKEKVLANVDRIVPNSTTELNAFRLDGNTEIELEGLPAISQKVLEFQKIGGLGKTIDRLREIIQLPLNHPEMFERFMIKPYRGILLYGPPGNGKTMFAHALKDSLGAKLFQIEGPELMSKYVADGERKLRDTFTEAEDAGNSIIFIDELDAIAVNRNNDSQGYEIRYVNTLLSLMDGMRSGTGIIVVGATNRINAIDPAFRRPGRFDLDFEIPLPNAESRFEIFKIHARTENNTFEDDVDSAFLKQFCDKAEGYSGADLAGVYRESVMNAVRKHLQFDDLGKSSFNIDPLTIKITKDNVTQAFENFKSHVKRVSEIK